MIIDINVEILVKFGLFKRFGETRIREFVPGSVVVLEKCFFSHFLKLFSESCDVTIPVITILVSSTYITTFSKESPSFYDHQSDLEVPCVFPFHKQKMQ